MDNETLATMWFDHHYLQEYEEELLEVRNKCAKQDPYIEELEERLKLVQEAMSDNLSQANISDARVQQLEGRLNQLRKNGSWTGNPFFPQLPTVGAWQSRGMV